MITTNNNLDYEFNISACENNISACKNNISACENNISTCKNQNCENNIMNKKIKLLLQYIKLFNYTSENL